MRGKTITIYIPDGNPRSVKICSTPTSTVNAIFIPRSKLKDDVAKRSELEQAGIYFLIGADEDILEVYIGEAEPVEKRLSQHNQNKEFWKYAICFTSVKNNLNKAHVKFLENYCYEKALEIKKCKITNSVIPTKSNLIESDRDFILDIFDELKLLISALGYPIFDQEKKEKKNLFYCKGKGAIGEGELIEDGFLIFKGSTATLDQAPSFNKSNIREKLAEKGILIKTDKEYIFNENYLFGSASTAGAVILGRSTNGWTKWKDKEGKTLDERFRNP